MAKKTPTTNGAPASRATVSLAAVSAAGTLPIITIPPGGTLTVVVDVGPMTIPYTVAYAGHNVIKSPWIAPKRSHRFCPATTCWPGRSPHTEKGWHHAIGFSVNGGPVQLLERKSEANKDSDHSLGAAIVRV